MTGDRRDYAARSKMRAKSRAAGPGRIGSAFHATTTDFVEPGDVRRMLVIDPGFVHTGLASFERTDTWRCQRAWKMAPLDAIAYVEGWLDGSRPGDLLVIESYVLYPWRMEQQGFSAMGTPEIIGVLRFLHRRRVGTGVLLMMQGADKKKTGRIRMKTHGIEHVGPNIHARDAEAHGWAWILQEEKSRSRARSRANRERQESMGREAITQVDHRKGPKTRKESQS